MSGVLSKDYGWASNGLVGAIHGEIVDLIRYPQKRINNQYKKTNYFGL
jgi:hypothetical protein